MLWLVQALYVVFVLSVNFLPIKKKMWFNNTITLTRCHKQKLNERGSDKRQKDGEESDIKNGEVQVNLKTRKKSVSC